MTIRPRVVVFCCEGRYQRHLVRRVAEEFDLVGVAWQSTALPKAQMAARLAPYLNPFRLIRHLLARALLPVFEKRCCRAVDAMFGQDDLPARSDGVNHVWVPNINDSAVAGLIAQTAPEIILVNGTQLLREPLLSLVAATRYGCLNLHTGLSPYSRGGNCNLYMLLEGRPDLMGVTVHHIDKGIDSGDIVRTAQLDLNGAASFEEIDARSFRQGIDLMLQSVRELQAGSALRVPQWTDGKLFLRRTGYVYEPWHRLKANLVVARGRLARASQRDTPRDASIRVVGGSS